MLTPKLRIGGGLRLRPQKPTETPVEAIPGAEVSEVLRRFKEDAVNAKRIFTENTDSEFWICLGFQNRAQKEEFLRLTGSIELGDKYLDGVAVADILGIELTVEVPKVPKFKIDRKLLKLVR